jgi:hypothetical protein
MNEGMISCLLMNAGKDECFDQDYELDLSQDESGLCRALGCDTPYGKVVAIDFGIGIAYVQPN